MQQTIYQPIIMQQIHRLLEALNDGRKQKEKYHLLLTTQTENYTIIAAINNENVVHNVVDEFGQIPDNFCVNWRSMSLIAHDLGYANKKLPYHILHHFTSSINAELDLKNKDIEAFWNELFKELKIKKHDRKAEKTP